MKTTYTPQGANRLNPSIFFIYGGSNFASTRISLYNSPNNNG